MKKGVDALLKGGDLSSEPALATPERALVFELKAPVADFIQAAQQVGLEWLTEEFVDEDLEIEDQGPDDVVDDYSADESDDDNNGATLYITMPTLVGLQKLLALWNRFVKGESGTRETKAWWKLFGYLVDLRVWSAKDRVDRTISTYVERMLSQQPDRQVRIEVDLWYRENPALRQVARPYLEALLETVGGSLVDFVTVDEIHYQAGLVDLPAAAARALQNLSGPIANAERVMNVRPQSVYSTIAVDSDGQELTGRLPPALKDTRPAIVALLDGYPVERHDLLRDRIDINEIDITGAAVPVAKRAHGTMMASLILHGELDGNEPPLDRILKVIPVLGIAQSLTHEETPVDHLPIGLIYRAVTALAVGLNGAEALAQRVAIINHSICDVEAPFARRPTPWARLLDFLSHNYRLLFVVSAGNIVEPFVLDSYSTDDELAKADHIQREIVLLRSLERAKGARSILSPAESMNSITVGAIHGDGGPVVSPPLIDPFSPVGVTNICSAAGLGINRAIKPDIVQVGGRQILKSDTTDGKVSVWGGESSLTGQLVAAPDAYGLSTSKTVRTSGTSNAAALTTRAAVRIADVVEQLFRDDGQDWSVEQTRAVVIKSLVAHSSSWRENFKLLDSVYPPHESGKWRRRREAISRFHGYGRIDLSRILSESGSRITLLADDVIKHGQRHKYSIPIPRSMVGNREVRRITMTLAYSSPIAPFSNRYRAVNVEMIDEDGKRNFWKGVKKVPQPHVDSTRKGTLQHLILEGKSLIKLLSNGAFTVCVQSMAPFKNFESTEVPYAMSISIELADSVRQDLNVDVASRVRPKVKTQVQVPVRDRIRS